MTTLIAITGASGFVGRACLAEARKRALPVLAITRSDPLPDWQDDEGITHLRLDLTAPDAAEALTEALARTLAQSSTPGRPADCALIHAAAHLGGDVAALARDTLAASRSVHSAWQTQQPRLVLISSLAVYDTDALAPGAALTESSPLIPLAQDALDQPQEALRAARDPYAGAKRLQEALFLNAPNPPGSPAAAAPTALNLTALNQTALNPTDCWVLRPGVIWGPGRSWHALQGFWASKLFVTLGSDGELPLVHVDHIARAALAAAQAPTTAPRIVNVFDDDRPTRARFLRAHKRHYGWPRLNMTLPYAGWAGLARLLRPVAKSLPGLLREDVLRARMMPLRYPNTELRHALGGEDIDSFEGMMARSHEAETTPSTCTEPGAL